MVTINFKLLKYAQEHPKQIVKKLEIIFDNFVITSIEQEQTRESKAEILALTVGYVRWRFELRMKNLNRKWRERNEKIGRYH